jgi:hypothetical protein
MIRAIRSIGVAALIIVATTAGSMVTADKAPPLDKNSRFLVGEIETDVTIPDKIPYQHLFTEKLTDRLKRKKLLAEPGDPNAMVIDSKVTEYKEGDLGGRFFSNAGESVVTIASSFSRGGKSVGTITVHNATGGSMGLYSIGSEAGVIEDAAEILVDTLAKEAKGE